MCTTLKVVKVNPVKSGTAKASQKPYEWHTAECISLDDAGNASSVGRLIFPRALREKLGGVPPIGTYQAVTSLVALTGELAGEIRPQIIDLLPVAFEGKSIMTSPALIHKIAQARKFAPHELPKARLCANVILAVFAGDNAMESAVVQLKLGLGNHWSPVTALQFMSGRRGEFAANCAEPQEQAQLYLAHLVAKQVCSDEGLGSVVPRDGIDVAKLHSLVAAVKTQFL